MCQTIFSTTSTQSPSSSSSQSWSTLSTRFSTGTESTSSQSTESALGLLCAPSHRLPVTSCKNKSTNCLHVATMLSGCDEPAPLPPGKPPLFSSWPLPVNVGLTPLPTSWPYTRSPPAMKSLVYALFLLMSAFSAALSLAITPALKDPHLHWVFLAIGLAGFACAIVMLVQFWNLDKWMAEEEAEEKD